MPSSSNFLTVGFDPPPGLPRPLNAGPFTLIFEGGDLRRVMLGGREVVRRIYAAVRDQNWNTIPGALSGLQVQEDGLRFAIRYVCEHRQDDLHFVWRAEFTGDEHGTIRFEFDGEARTTFLRNRIGCCVLHPIRECAGARCRAHLVDGTIRELTFPECIAVEQPVNGLCDLAGLDHEIEAGLWAALRFSGDVFETEDQRNWIDASFKTFSTPLRLPRPVEILAGTRVRQSVELRLQPVSPPAGSGDPKSPVPPGATVRVGRPGARFNAGRSEVNVSTQSGPVRLPDLGFGEASHGRLLESAEIARLSRLNPGHLRTDVKLADPDWRARLLVSARNATALGLPFELAVHLPADGCPDELPGVWRELTRTRADVLRVLAFQDGQGSTPGTALATIREHLGELGVPTGAGSVADLYQLHLQRPPSEADFICWGMNPQVHATDNTSIAETPEAAAQQVASVQERFPGNALVVSPVTLMPRPHAGATAATSSVGLPAPVDPRQMTLFGAAWTVAMLAALAPSGVESLTFFETTGWRGVMETVVGSPLPAVFPSEPGQVFPLWHVFAALSGFTKVGRTVSSDVLRVAALVLTARDGRRRLILANLTPASVRVVLEEARGGALRCLDPGSVLAATREPEAFWRTPGTAAAGLLPLAPHAIAFLDLQ